MVRPSDPLIRAPTGEALNIIFRIGKCISTVAANDFLH